MIRFNLHGLIIGMLALGLGFGVAALMGLTNENAGFGIAGVLMALVDGYLRLKMSSAEKRGERWFSDREGGFLILPLWLTGVMLLISPVIPAIDAWGMQSG